MFTGDFAGCGARSGATASTTTGHEGGGGEGRIDAQAPPCAGPRRRDGRERREAPHRRLADRLEAQAQIFPFLERRVGKAASSRRCPRRAEYEYLSYTPIFLVVEDEDSPVIILARVKGRCAGQVIQLILTHSLRSQDGRILQIRKFMDTLDDR